MSTYTYKDSKIIDEVTFKKSEGGHVRAYLHAADGTDPKSLHAIINECSQNDWQATPYNLGGKSVLEVHGFKSEIEFRNFVQEKGWAQGSSTYVKSQEDKLTFKEQVKKRSLGASGAFYMIGDTAFMKYGYAGGDWKNLVGGAMYGIGTLSLLGGGRKDQSDIQVRDIAKKLDSYLKENGADLPKECALDSIISDHNKGLIKKSDDIFRRYPSELMNFFYALAGVFIASSAYDGLKKPHIEQKSIDQVYKRLGTKKSMTIGAVEVAMLKSHKLESKLDIGLGAMTGLSGLFAMSVKEKAHDPDAPEKHGLGAAWQWIQEKPLAVAGIGYMVSTACHAVSTTLAWQYADDKKRASVPWRALFVGANVVAEILLAISSKGHGEGVKSDKSVDNTIISIAADAIVKQPAKMQPTLIDHVARFLGRKDVLAMKDDEVRTMLMNQVELMRKNPWAVAVQPAAGVEDAPDASVAEQISAPKRAAKEHKPAAWVSKAAESKAELAAQPAALH